jgi:hypothetical protein
VKYSALHLSAGHFSLPPAGPAFCKNAINPFYLSRRTILEEAIVSFLKKLCHEQARHRVTKSQCQREKAIFSYCYIYDISLKPTVKYTDK